MGGGGDLGISDATIRHSKGLVTWSLYRKKKQTNKQKLKQNKNENPKKPKVNIFLLKEGRVEGERRKSRKFWLENQMARIIPFRKL